MKLFHGSTISVKKPIIMDIQRLLDFGNGFYTTTNKKQATNWALIKQKRLGKNANAIISIYEFNDSLMSSQHFKIKTFNSATEEWLDFVVNNRNGKIDHSYDIVQGPVANDTLYATLLLYENGILSKNETILRLKTHKLFDQISFHSQAVLNELNCSNTITIGKKI